MSRLAEVADQSMLHNLLSAHLRAKPKNLLGFLFFSNWAKRVSLAKCMSLKFENSNVTECSLSESLALSEQIETAKNKT